MMNLLSDVTRLLDQFPVIGNAAWWLVPAAILLLAVSVAAVIRRRRRKPTLAETAGETPAMEVAAKTGPARAVIDEDSIAAFFLDLYKVQMGEPKGARSELKPLAPLLGQSGKTYELKVWHNKHWESRRMTVGPLGEESASRSRCYYVIYDHYLVVKIPRKPIVDFEVYIQSITADQAIAAKLLPRECIVPSVSAILHIVHPIPNGQALSAALVENAYLQRLRKFPRFQDYIKIGDTFVFIMDLARHLFLSKIISDFHDLPNRLYEEIVGYPDVIWENHGFEGRYAFENDEQVEAIRQVFTLFEKRMNALLKTAGHSEKIARFVLQKWFLLHLAGKNLEGGEKDLPSELVDKIRVLLDAVLAENKKIVETYRITIRGCIQSVSVRQNRKEITGLVANLLELLADLRHRGVAMRDLKPDNLLVAGDQKKYPEFLGSIDDYAMGLIDMETAVAYPPEGGAPFSQPILGGTPSYATPAHLVPNPELEHMFGDFSRILYLQDWYAAVGIVYELTTGERLFHQTGKMILGIKNVMRNNLDESGALSEVFKKTSQMFWHSAKTEFNKKVGGKKEILSSIDVPIADPVAAVFRKELAAAGRESGRRIRALVTNQEVFKGEKVRRGLVGATYPKIVEFRKVWQQQHGGERSGINLLMAIERLKLGSDRLAKASRLLDGPRPHLTADVLMEIMFAIVLEAMYNRTWGELVAAEVAGVADGSETTTVETTV
jgi:hypothetical protein